MNQFEVDGRTFTYDQKIMVYGKVAYIAGPSVEMNDRINYYRRDEFGKVIPGFHHSIPVNEVMPYGGGRCVYNAHNQCNHPFYGRHQLMTGFGNYLNMGDQRHFCQYPHSCI